MEQWHTEKDVNYELFILAVSVLAIVNILLALVAPYTLVREIATTVNHFLSILLLTDFGYRLFTAPSKRQYVVREFGWADALSGIPINGFQLWRVFRIADIVVKMHRERTDKLAQRYRAQRATSTLLTVAFMIICVVEFGSMEVIRAERGAADANIDSASDALWWSFVTITTVGYGDQYPVTIRGRQIGIVMMVAGVGLFSVLTGFLANAFLSPLRSRRRAKVAEETRSPPDIAAIWHLLDEHDRISAELRKRLAELEEHNSHMLGMANGDSEQAAEPATETPPTRAR